MKSYSLENIKRDKNQDSLYDIFSKTVVDQKINRLQNTVIDGEDGRLDKVSLRLYGSTNYVEELMIINNIINPFSIKVGDVIFYVETKNVEYLRQIEKSKEVSEKVFNKITVFPIIPSISYTYKF